MKELAEITNELSKYGQEDMDKGIPTDPSNPSYEEDEKKYKSKESLNGYSIILQLRGIIIVIM